MKIVAFFALLFALGGCGDNTAVTQRTQLEDLRGQWVLVNYWAQWCKPCIEEIPELNAFDARHTDVAVLGVNFEGTTGDELTRQEKSLGIAFPTIDDPSAQLGIPRPAVLPTTLLIDPTGTVVKQLLGPQTAETLGAAIAAAGNEPAG